MKEEYKISFCIPCMNRIDHLMETLPVNIEDNKDYPNVEFVLLDYNSSDGLEEWVKKEMMKHIESGVLVYYRTEEPKFFHMSHSKNVSHKLATGKIVCNLDADNFTTPGFARYIYNELKNRDCKIIFAKGASKLFGKLAIFKDDFINELNGYDEMMQNYGYEDRDLYERAKDRFFDVIFYGDKRFKRIEHSMEESTQNFRCKNTLASSEINKSIFKWHMDIRQTQVNIGKSWGVAKVIKNFNEEIVLT
jgi:glycosyltransferase involved in cell wall biosynthesis